MPSPESDSLTVSPSQPKLAVRVIAVTSAAKTVFSSTSLPSAVSQPPNASPATEVVAVGKVPIAGACVNRFSGFAVDGSALCGKGYYGLKHPFSVEIYNRSFESAGFGYFVVVNVVPTVETVARFCGRNGKSAYCFAYGKFFAVNQSACRS